MMARMEARFNYRLRVNRQQACARQQVFDSTRFVWSHTLGRWSDLWRHEGERLDAGAADKEPTDLRARFDWLAAQPSVPQRQVIRDLHKAIGAFLDNTNPAGRPRFKKGPRQGGEPTSGLAAQTGSNAGPTIRPDRCRRPAGLQDRDRNAARNLNPNRWDKPGAGIDGNKTQIPAGTKPA